MSPGLMRLIGRATGAAAPGLRPRLPSLFESGPSGGLSEIQSEVPAARAPPSADAGPMPPPEQGLRGGSEVSAPEASETHEARRREHPPDPLTDPNPRAAPSPTEAHSVTRRSEPAGQGSAEAPPPLLRTSEPVEPRIPLAPTAEPHHPETTPLAPLPPPPDPLLQETLREQLSETVIERLVGPPGSAAQPAPHDEVRAAEPEISIHIGRLDIRAEPQKPAPRPSAPARPSARTLPSLSDYLRGGSK